MEAGTLVEWLKRPGDQVKRGDVVAVVETQKGAIEVDIQDTSGASDVFRGAFAYALVQGWPLERSLPFANAAAGLNCRHLGGLAGIPSLAEVLRTAGLEPAP